MPLIVNSSECLECGGCIPLCPEEALFLSFDILEIDLDLCTLCRICLNFCPIGALEDSDAA